MKIKIASIFFDENNEYDFEFNLEETVIPPILNEIKSDIEEFMKRTNKYYRIVRKFRFRVILALWAFFAIIVTPILILWAVVIAYDFVGPIITFSLFFCLFSVLTYFMIPKKRISRFPGEIHFNCKCTKIFVFQERSDCMSTNVALPNDSKVVQMYANHTEWLNVETSPHN